MIEDHTGIAEWLKARIADNHLMSARPGNTFADCIETTASGLLDLVQAPSVTIRFATHLTRAWKAGLRLPVNSEILMVGNPAIAPSYFESHPSILYQPFQNTRGLVDPDLIGLRAVVLASPAEDRQAVKLAICIHDRLAPPGCERNFAVIWFTSRGDWGHFRAQPVSRLGLFTSLGMDAVEPEYDINTPKSLGFPGAKEYLQAHMPNLGGYLSFVATHGNIGA